MFSIHSERPSFIFHSAYGRRRRGYRLSNPSQAVRHGWLRLERTRDRCSSRKCRQEAKRQCAKTSHASRGSVAGDSQCRHVLWHAYRVDRQVRPYGRVRRWSSKTHHDSGKSLFFARSPLKRDALGIKALTFCVSVCVLKTDWKHKVCFGAARQAGAVCPYRRRQDGIKGRGQGSRCKGLARKECCMIMYAACALWLNLVIPAEYMDA